eukprot:CAMPEP_0172453940 /NCGR_PEP_ID=MMETSP1065-20121228/11077_1 /TAXON_ID=265537 /ORGANISM="Amphiprora paludosa, Strain CCMP125" /LENGTH=129 /DNA_ID=CAMNT_0013206189 /DNA_START=104 /DNA_END=493 /DNA_ORIENTATION=+
MPLMMVSAKNATARHPAFAIFRTWPRATKHEIKEYLTKIYQLPVAKVRTMNYEGKRKRLQTQKFTYFYKYANFKKAVVTFDRSMTDVGIGTHVPELEDQKEEDEEVMEGEEESYERKPPVAIESGKESS